MHPRCIELEADLVTKYDEEVVFEMSRGIRFACQQKPVPSYSLLLFATPQQCGVLGCNVWLSLLGNCRHLERAC